MHTVPSPLRKKAEAGDAIAGFNLGVMYLFGEKAKKDYVEAIKWFRKAAEQGLPDAQHQIGLMYASGKGVEKDSVEAYAWLHVSAENGKNDAANVRDLLPT